MKILSTYTETTDDISSGAVSTFAAIKIVLRIFIQGIGAETRNSVSFPSCGPEHVCFYVCVSIFSGGTKRSVNTCHANFPSINHVFSPITSFLIGCKFKGLILQLSRSV